MLNDDGNTIGMSFKFQGVKKDTDLSSQFSVQLFLPKVCCKTSLRISCAFFIFQTALLEGNDLASLAIGEGGPIEKTNIAFRFTNHNSFLN